MCFSTLNQPKYKQYAERDKSHDRVGRFSSTNDESFTAHRYYRPSEINGGTVGGRDTTDNQNHDYRRNSQF